MPAYDVLVTATFEKIVYNLTAAAAQNGSISFKVNGKAATTATIGDEVEIVAAPAENYLMGGATADSAEVEIENNTFTMPAANVTITPTFVSAIHFDNDFSAYTSLTGDADNTVLVANTVNNTAVDTSKAKSIEGITLVPKQTGNGYANSAVKYFNKDNSQYLEVTVSNTVSNNRDIEIEFDNAPDARTLKYTVLEMDTKMLKGTGSNDPGFSITGADAKEIGVGVTNGITAGEKVNLKIVIGDNVKAAIVTDANDKVYVTDISALNLQTIKKLDFNSPAGGNGKYNYIEIHNMKLYQTDDELIYPAVIEVKAGDNAVEGADVTVAGQTLKTNAEGKVTVNVPAGTYPVTVSKYGYAAPAEAQVLTVTDDGANTATIAMTAKTAKDVTFGVSAEGATFTVVVKQGDTVIAPKETDGKVYSLFVGETYTYSITPTGTTAAAYDPSGDKTLAVTAETATVNETLPAKTYDVTFTGLPQYAKVSYKVGTQETATEVYTNETGALAAIENVPANAVITYSVTKGGYTAITDATTDAITADTSVPVTMQTATAGVLWTEDFTTTGIADRDVSLFGNQRIVNNRLQIYGAKDVALSGITGKSGYEIALNDIGISGTDTGRARTKTISFSDSSNNVLFKLFVEMNYDDTHKNAAKRISINDTDVTDAYNDVTGEKLGLKATITDGKITVKRGDTALITDAAITGGADIAKMSFAGNSDVYLTVDMDSIVISELATN